MWVQTLIGRKVDLFDPDPAAIDLYADVATSLGRQPRFNGHTRFPYSIAQHSVLGAQYLLEHENAPASALRFLLHDAHEAYTGDIASPVISAVCDHTKLRFVRHKLDRAIWKAATRLDWPCHELIGETVSDIDLAMLRTERDQLCETPPESWGADVENAAPLPIKIEPLTNVSACFQWCRMLHRLQALVVNLA